MLKKSVPILAAALLLTATVGTANAEITLFGNKTDAKSWAFSTDGFLNTFLVYQDSDAAPAHTAGVGTIVPGQSTAIRTGLLPGLIAFNVKAPSVNGIDITARLGFYPQIQAGGTRSTFSSQIDTRELWFAADGSFGQVLAGKALNLFQGKSILTDMTLFGVGDPGSPKSGGTTLGHIGSGYLYAEFSPNIRYTTPDFGGLKVAVSLVDPSKIAGSGNAATTTKSPAVEAEITYNAKFTGGTAQAWVNGLYQHAKFDATAAPALVGDSVNASGVSGGVQVGFAGAELLASGFTGKGLGSLLLLDTDSLDAAGKERKSSGFLVQGTYMIAPTNTKLGINYGMNFVDETAADQAERTAGTAELKDRSALTFGVYQNITPSWQVMAEYTRSTNTWYNDAEQKANTFSVGTFFFF
jgi:hypothetical protein